MENIRKKVRQGYANVAKRSRCCDASPPCGSADVTHDIGKQIGYSDEELGAVPEGANLGLGCGNPVATASLKKGETVLDLGSGAGFDCFLAAEKVGKSGMVIGVDMTPEMIDKARENAQEGNYTNVEFRLGEIENLPVADNSVDVIISNCVINLSPDKRRVFAEAYRVLKPGGRLMVSDIVLLGGLPAFIRNSVEAYVSCVSGAMMKDDYINAIKAAGFQQVKVIGETAYPIDFVIEDATLKTIVEESKVEPGRIKVVADLVRSIKVCGVKMS